MQIKKALAALVFAVFGSSVYALPITVTFEGTLTSLSGLGDVTVSGTLFTIDSSLIGSPIDLNTSAGRTIDVSGATTGSLSQIAPNSSSEMQFVFTNTNLASLAGNVQDATSDGQIDAVQYAGLLPSTFDMSLLSRATLRLDGFGGFLNASNQYIGSVTYSFAVASVPEPGTLALLAFGLLGLALTKRLGWQFRDTH